MWVLLEGGVAHPKTLPTVWSLFSGMLRPWVRPYSCW